MQNNWFNVVDILCNRLEFYEVEILFDLFFYLECAVVEFGISCFLLAKHNISIVTKKQSAEFFMSLSGVGFGLLTIFDFFEPEEEEDFMDTSGCLNMAISLASFAMSAIVRHSNEDTDGGSIALGFLAFYFFFNFLDLADCLIELLFVLELYGVIYYFFFLDSIELTSKIKSIKLINLLYLYVWNTFISTILYCMGCYFILQCVGTVDFEELSLFEPDDIHGFIFILTGFSLKLGLPFYQIYKINCFESLSQINSIMFSTNTTVSTLTFLDFFFSEEFFCEMFADGNYMGLSTIFMGGFLFYFMCIDSFQLFICYSGLITLSLSLLYLGI